MAKIHVSDCPGGLVLDAAVALAQGLHIDNLAGYWKDDEGNNVHPACVGCTGIPTWHPSGDIRAAWPLLDELWSKGGVQISLYAPFGGCAIKARGMETGASNHDLPLAITRAYLLAHGITQIEVPGEAADD